MPCESCAVQFSVFRRRRACPECERWYCGGCLRRGGGTMCAACRALSTRPLARHAIAHLKVRDLQAFLQRQNVSTRGCVEKEELLALCVSHVNSSGYRRRARSGAGPGASAFSSLKGFTSNINEFINHAFDIRPQAQPAPAPTSPPPPTTAANSRSSCYNSSHPHARGAPPATSPLRPPAHNYATSPAGNVRSSSAFFSPRGSGAAGVDATSPDTASSRSSSLSARVDTADCFEVEDLDDSGWEFVSRPPADPLPNDSEVLLTVEENSGGMTEDDVGDRLSDGGREPVVEARAPRPPAPAPHLLVEETSAPATPLRAASELDLRRSPSHTDTDTASLKDEPMFPLSNGVSSKRVVLEDLHSPSDLEALSVRQLKELLSANRVEYRGCLERADLLERATTLYTEHAKFRDQLESLPLEECCKICMAAPLECVLLECGHMAACTDCGKRLAECPICRRYVTRAVRFFRS